MIQKILPEGRDSLRHIAYQIGPGRYYQPAYRFIAAAMEIDEGALLDVGCGPGWVSIYAAQGKPELDCVGIDHSATMINLANRNKGRRLNCTFREMDAREIIYPDATFDRIVSVQSMHHWEEPDAVLAELARVAKPGGLTYLYAADADAEVPEGWIERRGPWPTDGYVRSMWRKYSLTADAFADIKRRVEAAGWASVTEDRHGFYRRIVAER